MRKQIYQLTEGNQVEGSRGKEFIVKSRWMTGKESAQQLPEFDPRFTACDKDVLCNSIASCFGSKILVHLQWL